MRIADGWRPEPAAHVRSEHPRDAAHRRPSLRRQHARRGLSSARTRHLQAGTARRALARNLAHLQRCLADPRLPHNERQILHQSVAALEVSLQDHHALRTNMAAMILG